MRLTLAALVCLGVSAVGASFDDASAGAGVVQDKQVRTAYPEKRGLALSEFPRVITLADGVYGYEEIRNPGFTTVSLFVVGTEGVLIADGQGSPAATRTMLDTIAKITPLPVKWYVVGSDHGDHTGGNSELPKDVTFIVSRTSQEQMKLAVPPMTGELQTINVGGMEVQAVFAGRAHTGGDLMVHLPKQKILFMSEAYLNRVFPAMRSAYPTEWADMIDRVLRMDVNWFIPGHGFIEEAQVSRDELVEFQKALRAVIAEVKRLHKLGLSADEAAKQANWGTYKDWFLAEQQGPIAVRKVYEEIAGKLK